MWWCCGSTDKRNSGCKTDYHVSKSYNQGEEMQIGENSDVLKRTICRCCKLKGHSVKDCPLDPNYRTTHSIYDEYFRILGLKDVITKRFAKDSLKQTLQLLQNMVHKRDASPFMRGALLFDDYNYNYYNKSLMPDIDELLEEEGDFESASMSFNSSKDQAEGDAEGDDIDDIKQMKRERKQRRQEEKEQQKKQQEDDDEDPFTINELREIQFVQQEDPFEDLKLLQNSVRLDNLNLVNQVSIQEVIKELTPIKPIARGLTMATSSKRDDETEVYLFNKNSKYSNKNIGIENDSEPDSYKNNNLDITTQRLNVPVDTSYSKLLKDKSREGEDSNSEEGEEFNTGRAFKSIDNRIKGHDLLSKIGQSFQPTSKGYSAFSHREQKSLREETKVSTPKGAIAPLVKKQKRLLNVEMDQMIEDELDKELDHTEKARIVRKNTKKLRDQQKKKEEESTQLDQLLD